MEFVPWPSRNPAASRGPTYSLEPIDHRISRPERAVSTVATLAVDQEEQPPASAVSRLPEETWKHPRINLWRFIAACYSFAILGLNDAAYGPLIPYLEQFYNVSYTVVSLVFLSPLIGYVTSALLNNKVHVKYGQRGVAILSPGAHLVSYIIISQHPPFPVLVFAYVLAGFGNGLADAAWNAWIGGMPSSNNELLGIIHACFGAGATMAPTIATSLITKANWQWYQYYYLAIGFVVVELVFLTTAFWKADAKAFRDANPEPESETLSNSPALHEAETRKLVDRLIDRYWNNSMTGTALRSRVTWVCSIFISIYAGAEVGLGGWVVAFMMKVRHGSAFASGMSATGFWLGTTVGRIVLGFATPRLFKSEKHAVIVYLGCTIALELMFWLIPQFYVSAVMISLVGFFLGPLFPCAIVAATRLLPKHLHVSAIGFAAAIGASGSTTFPFAVGAIAQARGVWILQPFILGILVACLGIWLFLPSLSKKHQ
ncbi:hypothetical protein FQN57_007016 [Myotisia sp. PD_48]|nr:hypothetical protein FQN57_007016 [Myotisia sp. PD_48]